MSRKFYRVRPTRPFDIWKHSENDGKGNLTKIVFQYDFYTPDCFFGQTGRYFGTRSLSQKAVESGLTGVQLQPVITSYAKDYKADAPNEPVNEFLITGAAASDDFGMQSKTALIVSRRGMDVIKSLGFIQGEIFDYDPSFKMEIPAYLLNDSDEE